MIWRTHHWAAVALLGRAGLGSGRPRSSAAPTRIVGSEGTLAVFTELWLRLVPRTAVSETIARTREIGAARGLSVATHGQAGDRNLHSNFLWAFVPDRPAACRGCDA